MVAGQRKLGPLEPLVFLVRSVEDLLLHREARPLGLAATGNAGGALVLRPLSDQGIGADDAEGLVAEYLSLELLLLDLGVQRGLLARLGEHHACHVARSLLQEFPGKDAPVRVRHEHVRLWQPCPFQVVEHFAGHPARFLIVLAAVPEQDSARAAQRMGQR